jgi:hypothetical protein
MIDFELSKGFRLPFIRQINPGAPSSLTASLNKLYIIQFHRLELSQMIINVTEVNYLEMVGKTLPLRPWAGIYNPFAIQNLGYLS